MCVYGSTYVYYVNLFGKCLEGHEENVTIDYTQVVGNFIHSFTHFYHSALLRGLFTHFLAMSSYCFYNRKNNINIYLGSKES